MEATFLLSGLFCAGELRALNLKHKVLSQYTREAYVH